MRLPVLLLSCALLAGGTPPDPFACVRFLEGEWVGEGTGAPGPASGTASFRFELEGGTLVRRSHADLPGGQGRPPSRHEDLLVIHPEGAGLRALYLDNERHVIHYAVTPLAAGEGAVFLSEGPGPRFRMTYRRSGADTAAFRFEVAGPGTPEAFVPYLEAATRRVVRK
jgi:hypothetical protein